MTQPEDEGEAVRQARLWRAEKRRLEALGQLAAGIAHEFNNLLAVISNSTYLLRRVDDETRRDALLQQIETATRRGAELMRRVPNFARADALRSRMVDMPDVAGELEDLMHHVVRSNIKVRLDLPASLWPVAADYGELQLALLQLCVNAREAMPDGGDLELRGGNRTLNATEASRLGVTAGDYVELTLTDTGFGLAPETVQRARDLALLGDERAEDERGLVQVFGFAHRARGAIEVSSQRSRGTAIRFILPRASPAMTGFSSRGDAVGAVRGEAPR